MNGPVARLVVERVPGRPPASLGRRARPVRSALSAAFVALAAVVAPAALVAAQEEADSARTPPDTLAAPAPARPAADDTATAPRLPPDGAASFLGRPAQAAGVGPGGAFWRSLLVPGWGHAVVGAHGRGAFYFGAVSGVAYMLFKSIANRNSAQRIRNARADVAAERLRRMGTLEDSIPLLLLEDDAVVEAQELVDTRGQQVQDWIALGAFLTLLSGADAFVSAHLIDFPEPLSIDVLPGGRVEVGASVPWRGPG